MSNFLKYSKLQQLQSDVQSLKSDLKKIKTSYKSMLRSLIPGNVNYKIEYSTRITVQLINTKPSYVTIKNLWASFELNLNTLFENYYFYDKDIAIRQKPYLIKLFSKHNILTLEEKISNKLRNFYYLYYNFSAYLKYEFTFSDSDINIEKLDLDEFRELFYAKHIIPILEHFDKELLYLEHDIQHKLSRIKEQIDQELKSGKLFLPDFNVLFLSDDGLRDIIHDRYREMVINIKNETHLSAIFMMGSILEGLLLHIVSKNPQLSNSAKSTPKKEGKAKNYQEWTLNDLIVVAHELGWIEKTTADFSLILKNYRNFIHPREQLGKKITTSEIANTYQLNLKAFELVVKKLQEHIEKDQIKS